MAASRSFVAMKMFFRWDAERPVLAARAEVRTLQIDAVCWIGDRRRVAALKSSQSWPFGQLCMRVK
jgi:hypothetical protein